jgi:hypothetical protein
MYKLDTPSTLTYLKQRIHLIKLTIPAESTLWDIIILFLYNGRMSLMPVILGRGRTCGGIGFYDFGREFDLLEDRLV